MSDIDVKRMRELCELATPGPWQWFGNTNHHEVYLATVNRGRVFVMDFVRWGMSGAQPRFQVALNGGDDSGVMRSVGEMAKNEAVSKPTVVFGPLYEAPYRKQFTGIGHPDAAFIAASRTLVPDLLGEVGRLRAQLTEVAGFMHGLSLRDDLNYAQGELKAEAAAIRAAVGGEK